MTALDHLSRLLHGKLSAAEWPHRQLDGLLDETIKKLETHNKSGANSSVPEDLLQAAVRKFWDTQCFETFRDARLVSFGMCVPSRDSGPCIMEDRQRFQAVLDRQTGVDQWVNEPRWYRRCYQGLVRSYFTYDAKLDQVPTVGKQNWADLREYLKERTRNIVDRQVNPDWVITAVENRKLFENEPCAPYAADVLSGDRSQIDLICEQLGVVKSSWFLRELILAQVRQATKLNHERFKDLIPRLLELLSKNLVLRDRGLILILNKYVSATHSGINEPLQNASVEWWGNPWLPSNEARWGGVVPAAREMVTEWLKREFIEAFFTKLAEDGVGDRRRAEFWLRYVKSMDNIQFALGTFALLSRNRDFDTLRKKMAGLYTELKTTDSSNNAFIMTLGDLVAVEFGGMGNAFYGYDLRETLPFDASRPVCTTINAPNSLKHKDRMLWMQHQDGIKGWNKWEEMFEATLKEHFDIRPDATARRIVPLGGAAAVPVSTILDSAPAATRLPAQPKATGQNTCVKRNFSMGALHAFTRAHKFEVDDNRKLNGNLWVRTDNNDTQINKTLLDWGFRYKSGKGWWR